MVSVALRTFCQFILVAFVTIHRWSVLDNNTRSDRWQGRNRTGADMAEVAFRIHEFVLNPIPLMRRSGLVRVKECVKKKFS